MKWCIHVHVFVDLDLPHCIYGFDGTYYDCGSVTVNSLYYTTDIIAEMLIAKYDIMCFECCFDVAFTFYCLVKHAHIIFIN